MNRKSWKQFSRFCLVGLSLYAALPVFGQGTFGTVVPIGGHASDLALDQSRGVLYVANYSAGLIDVMSLNDNRIQRSINVGGQPGSLAVSPDGKYLVVTQFGNFQAPNSPNNGLTVVDLNSGSKQTFSMSTPPLGVAFGIDGRALVVTSTDFIRFDPATGTMQVLNTVSGLTVKTLPQPAGTAPSQIVATSVATSGDGSIVYGITDTFYFRYDSLQGKLNAGGYVSSPTLGPRALSVNRDGSVLAAGWALLDPDFWIISQFPNVTGALNVGSVLIDSQRNLIYAQMGEVGSTAPVLQIADADSLRVRERLTLQENLSGKSVLSGDGSTMYAVSESGVYVLPVGDIASERRLILSKSDVVFRGNFCDRSVSSQEISITSEGGSAGFTLVSDNPAIRISPATGTTPATVRVTVDPSAFQNQKGTVAAKIEVLSRSAVNKVPPIRVLINSREPDQRGTMINLPGTLSDILADPDRDRFFILRQDTNEVLVYDGASFTQVAALRTHNTPKSMAITFDRRFLLVAAADSFLVNVFDLETLQPERPIQVPAYPQSIAASSRAILIATRAAGGGSNQIYKADVASRVATALPSLGSFDNKIDANTVVIGSANGRSILIAQADGTLMLYNAIQDTFTVARKESTPLLGAYAASNFDQFVVGNALLNSSLVPARRFEDAGASSGFAFLDDRTAFRHTAASASSPGVLQRVDLTTGGGIRPTRTAEAPILGSTTSPFTRTLAPLYSRNAIVALTTSGFTVFPWNYDAGAAPPRIDRIVNAADFTQPMAPGGLVTVLGADLSPVSQSSRQVPLPTALGESCLTVNGVPVPVMFVSPQQINAQLPFAVEGATTLVLRTPSGVSDNFNITINPAAPSVFRTGVAGPQSDIPTVIRTSNNEVVTPSNPIHRGDVVSIYATGLGRTMPSVESGVPAPSEPLAAAIITPDVSIGGAQLEVLYAGLTPGQVGVYQINVKVGGNVPLGFSLPLQISQGGIATTVSVRVVQ